MMPPRAYGGRVAYRHGGKVKHPAHHNTDHAVHGPVREGVSHHSDMEHEVPGPHQPGMGDPSSLTRSKWIKGNQTDNHQSKDGGRSPSRTSANEKDGGAVATHGKEFAHGGTVGTMPHGPMNKHTGNHLLPGRVVKKDGGMVGTHPEGPLNEDGSHLKDGTIVKKHGGKVHHEHHSHSHHKDHDGHHGHHHADHDGGKHHVSHHSKAHHLEVHHHHHKKGGHVHKAAGGGAFAKSKVQAQEHDDGVIEAKQEGDHREILHEKKGGMAHKHHHHHKAGGGGVQALQTGIGRATGGGVFHGLKNEDGGAGSGPGREAKEKMIAS